MEFAEKFIKPQDCTIAFGMPIPLTKNEFCNILNIQLNKHFLKMFYDGTHLWKKYWHEIGSNIKSLIPVFKEMGVTIEYNVTLEMFGNLFSQNFQVITLFSHWREDAVEFSDGFADIASIVEQIPINFVGVLDLCVCHPKPLVTALKETRPHCLIRDTNRKATPYIWLFFYLCLFKQMQSENVSYFDALEKTIQQVLN